MFDNLYGNEKKIRLGQLFRVFNEKLRVQRRFLTRNKTRLTDTQFEKCGYKLILRLKYVIYGWNNIFFF